MDIRAKVSESPDAFTLFANEFRDRYPKVEVKRSLQAELRVEGGKLVPPTTESLGFHGVRISNPDETILVQFRPDGFTLNNLKEYVGGDLLISEALRFWSLFAARMTPTSISRVAFRYINQLDFPLRLGDDFTTFLTSPPVLPPELPQETSQFLSRIVAHPSEETILAVTQRLTPTPSGPLVLLDIDVSHNRDFSGNAEELRESLDALRRQRNQAFFALLTDSAVNLYV